MTLNLNNTALNNINADDVAGYRILREFFNKTKYSIHAVDHKGNLLVCVAGNLDFDEAGTLVETLNFPYEEALQQELLQTELVEVKVENDDRIFTALKSTETL